MFQTPQSIIEWHDKLLEHLLSIRAKEPDFTFYLRKKNNKERLKGGHWFHGNHNYIFIGFYKPNGGVNMTKSIGFVVGIDEQGNASAHLEIVFKGEKDSGLLDLYNQCIEKIQGFKQVDETKYTRPYSNEKNIFSNLDDFIQNQKPVIDQLIMDMGLEEKMMIPDEEFAKSLNRIQSIRNNNNTMDANPQLPGMIIANITWNSNDWKAPSNDPSNHSWVKDGNIPHESWNFDIDNPRNKGNKILGYSQWNAAPSLKDSDNIVVFYSKGKIVGFYGEASFLKVPEPINDAESFNIVARKNLSFVLDNKIDDIKEKGYLEDKKRVGQAGFNYLKNPNTVLTILEEAKELNPQKSQQIRALKSWIEERTQSLSPNNNNNNNNNNNEMNQILFGPPGTGKTYHTIDEALKIIDPDFYDNHSGNRKKLHDRFGELLITNWDAPVGNIAFCTFHQSFSYEDFVEGIKPQTTEAKDIIYNVEPGIFKRICQLSVEKKPSQDGTPQKEDNPNKYVLILDEINRGNVASIFGELITLIEKDKRAGGNEELEITLPYSKETFKVPNNVYLLGTMNTADRSIEALDTALRRRFSFKEMPSRPEIIAEAGNSIDGIVEGIDLPQLLTAINQRVEKLIDKDHMIGHSYFLNVSSLADLKLVFFNKVIPLLQEYFFGDYGKIGLVLGESFVTLKNNDNKFANFRHYDQDILTDLEERKVFEITNLENWEAIDFIRIYQ